MLHVKVLSSFYISQLDETLLSLQGPENLSIIAKSKFFVSKSRMKLIPAWKMPTKQ